MMSHQTALSPHSPVQTSSSPDRVRLRLQIRGAVQGVGFRPFLYRLAQDANLPGFVRNTAGGVHVEVEGDRQDLDDFRRRIQVEKPELSIIQSLEPSYLDPVGFGGFSIVESAGGEKTAFILPDIATCPSCRADIFSKEDRRYRYPFTNCAHCGPRYSILKNLPYDRANTTMANFVLCKECRDEYEDPTNRRFHAQPNACPRCGPRLELWDPEGRALGRGDEALLKAEEAILQGEIVAIKGLGGFQLIANAADEEAVDRLRRRKLREEKPFAVMVADTSTAHSLCKISDVEERLLQSPEAPIVLLERRPKPDPDFDADALWPCQKVSPGNPWMGLFLPYTPLHHLLLSDLGLPLVATSANRVDEPMCIDNEEALAKLNGIADLFLVHDRPILRQVDDSVVREMGGRELVLRRARGYAPLPISTRDESPSCLAVGALLKNTVAASLGAEVYVSQHIGDLESKEALDAFAATTAAFGNLKGFEPEIVACDLHPDYLSTQYARSTGLPRVEVQHHYAHVLSCMAENEIEGPVLGVCWDGAGLGTDETIWGGEFLAVDDLSYGRIGHLRTFPLPGGDKASREPRRSVLGILYEIEGAALFDERDRVLESFSERERTVLKSMLERNVNTPRTSSAGRLFDGVCALLGIRSISSYEGQAAMELEFRSSGAETDAAFDVRLTREGPDDPDGSWVLDWEPMIRRIVSQFQSGTSTAILSAMFHNTLAESIVLLADRVGEERVVLTGGCFQNRTLTERTIKRLREEGFKPYWHQRIPPNDGGISLGQVMAASRERRRN